jgi:aspartyl-tRNA(Asn)/glutamyl-tRNA(Gln) amidotransferase subunit B
VLNERAVMLAARAAFALGCEVHAESTFARKNYFYPDLPKGYQISQFDRPIATNGRLALDDGDDSRMVRIHRVHMEEDAGKSIHDRFPGSTAIDLNRSGTPLIEIVSEPDLRSAADTGIYLKRLKQILEYLEVSDANMEEGSLRVDANISIRERGTTTYGTKTEIKNMNSFHGIERALEVEFARQVAVVEDGGHVIQQTMLFDTQRGETRPARSKEESHDYRYFPEPDLTPLRLTSEWLAGVKSAVPELPASRRARLVKAGLPVYDAEVLTASRALAEYYDAVAAAHGDAKVAANWVMGEVLAKMNNRGESIGQLRVTPSNLAALLDLVKAGEVSNSAAKTIFAAMIDSGEAAAAIADREGLRQVGDDSQLTGWIDEVLKSNPDEAKRYLAGEKKLLGVLVGKVMKVSGGKADPKKVNRLLSERA